MNEKPLVIYHANCADGFCAAWVANRYFKGQVDFYPANYGQPPPDVTGRRVFILDFSYKRGVLLQMAEVAASVVVLDHHKTAEQELSMLKTTNPLCVFDMNKSGGRLAWEFFFPGEDTPWIVNYTEDRDLWRWKLPHSKAISAWFSSIPWEFETLDSLYPSPGWKCEQDLIEQGDAILRYQSQVVDLHVKNAVEIEMDGHKILSVNASTMFSEIAGKLAKGRPFGACWFVRSDGVKQWSLRSRDDGVDVSEIARRHGGGGHRNAAGFEEKP